MAGTSSFNRLLASGWSSGNPRTRSTRSITAYVVLPVIIVVGPWLARMSRLPAFCTAMAATPRRPVTTEPSSFRSSCGVAAANHEAGEKSRLREQHPRQGDSPPFLVVQHEEPSEGTIKIGPPAAWRWRARSHAPSRGQS
jgi:hypothetical protein